MMASAPCKLTSLVALTLCLAWLAPAHAQPGKKKPAGAPGKKAGKKAGKKKGKSDAPESRSKKNRILLDRVVAVVNDHVILSSELELRILPLSAELASIADDRERERRRRKLIGQILDEMVNDELIVQAAKEAQLRVEPKEIQAALDEIKKQNNLDDAGLEQALAMQGYSVSGYKKDVERQIVRMRATNILVRPRVTITDEDVRARFDEMNRRSSAVGKVYLKHIVVGLPQSPSDRQVAEAKQRATAIMEQARSGKDFSDLAREVSDDKATAASGGDLGWIERGDLDSEWEVVVFAMDKGEVRGPINGPSGLHVFYVADVEKNERKGFEQVKDKIKNELFRKEMDRQTKLWLQELRKQAHISLKT